MFGSDNFKSLPYEYTGTKEHFFMTIPQDRQGGLEGYRLEQGILFSFNDIHISAYPYIPSKIWNTLTFNLCLSGRCETSLPEEKSAILSAGFLTWGTQQAQKDFYYPTSHYQGIELFIDLDQVDPNGYFAMSGIDLESICRQLGCREELYFSRAPERGMEISRQLWAIKGTEDMGKIRLLTALLLRELSEKPYRPETMTWFTPSQIGIAREVAELLTEDLSVRIPAKDLARRFGISESSLKQYFYGVFGESFLEYQRKRRVRLAKTLLSDTEMKIVDVAAQCGYENQSKFANVFKQLTGTAPLEYRRLQRVDSVGKHRKAEKKQKSNKIFKKNEFVTKE